MSFFFMEVIFKLMLNKKHDKVYVLIVANQQMQWHAIGKSENFQTYVYMCDMWVSGQN